MMGTIAEPKLITAEPLAEPRAGVGASPPPALTGATEPVLTILQPTSGWQLVNFRELWRFRELLFFLAWRDLCVRYRQTVLGIAWAVLQPLATMLVFTLFLARAMNQDTLGVPYSLFAYAGLAPWFFFANAIGAAGQSVVSNQNLITKIWFPRLLIPLSAVAVALVDFLVSCVVLAGWMLWFGVAPGWDVLLLPVLMLVLLLAALGVGTLLSALTVCYRDFRHVLTFLVQLWLFATPSVYLETTGWLSGAWLGLNPAHGLISGFRASLLGTPWDVPAVLSSAMTSIVLLGLGCLYFRRVERSFADII
jgi:lipopolysaccharide transport system permease protein